MPSNPILSKLVEKPHPDSKVMVPETGQRITLDRLRELLPAKTPSAVTQEMVDLINRMEEDCGLPQELLEEGVMSHMHLINNQRGSGIKDLVNAIKFCNLKRNYDNKEAWAIVFPDKYHRLVEENKQVDSHVSMYNSSKLVTAIDKEMLIPLHLIYSQYLHAAIHKQFEIMSGRAADTVDGKKQTVSPMVQHLAAKELAAILKPPEETKLNVTINPGAEAMSAQAIMNDQLKQIVANQRAELMRGGDIIDVQLIKGLDFTEVGKSNG